MYDVPKEEPLSPMAVEIEAEEEAEDAEDAEETHMEIEEETHMDAANRRLLTTDIDTAEDDVDEDHEDFEDFRGAWGIGEVLDHRLLQVRALAEDVAILRKAEERGTVRDGDGGGRRVADCEKVRERQVQSQVRVPVRERPSGSFDRICHSRPDGHSRPGGVGEQRAAAVRLPGVWEIRRRGARVQGGDCAGVGADEGVRGPRRVLPQGCGWGGVRRH
jgi:hypothetical protein